MLQKTADKKEASYISLDDLTHRRSSDIHNNSSNNSTTNKPEYEVPLLTVDSPPPAHFPSMMQVKYTIPDAPAISRVQRAIERGAMVIINPNSRFHLFSYFVIILSIVMALWRTFLSIFVTIKLTATNGSINVITQIFMTVSSAILYFAVYLRLWYFYKYYHLKSHGRLLNDPECQATIHDRVTLNNRVTWMFISAVGLYLCESISIWAIYARFYSFVC